MILNILLIGDRIFKINILIGQKERLKMKKTNNKGFSLVELIIVIAIMAILIGVLAPQYIKYVEKSRASADKDLLDSVYNACTIAASDPDVTDAPGAGSTVNIAAGNDSTKFENVVYNTLGCDLNSVSKKLKSKSTSGQAITISVGSQGDFTVTCGSITIPEVAGSN